MDQRNLFQEELQNVHCVESVLIRSFSVPYFPAFKLNTAIYGVNLSVQSECGKIRVRQTPKTDTFHTVVIYRQMRNPYQFFYGKHQELVFTEWLFVYFIKYIIPLLILHDNWIRGNQNVFKIRKKEFMSLSKPKRVLEETNHLVFVWISFFLFWFILSVYYHYLWTNFKHFFNALKHVLICWYVFRSSPPEVFLGKRCSENMQQIYRRTPMSKRDFNKVVLQLYWNYTSACVFFCKFAAYILNTFL